MADYVLVDMFAQAVTGSAADDVISDAARRVRRSYA